ncbi:MAG: hypothetical protein EBX36_04930 [Planctomycetia bacterium]|nr:hypothetical protein [Planctomycetia bacterium]
MRGVPADIRTAIGAIAIIKDAVEAFDRGDLNLFDALDLIAVAVTAAAGGNPTNGPAGRPLPRQAVETRSVYDPTPLPKPPTSRW